MMLGVWIGLLCHFTHNVHLNGQDHGRGLDWLLCYIVSSEWARATEYPGPLPLSAAHATATPSGIVNICFGLNITTRAAESLLTVYCTTSFGLGLICCRATVYMGKSCCVASLLSTAFLHIAA